VTTLPNAFMANTSPYFLLGADQSRSHTQIDRVVGNLLCANEKRVWVSTDLQRGSHPWDEVRDHRSPPLRRTFSLPVQSLSDSCEQNQPSGEKLWIRP
jgi:hypothetical protein